MGRKKHRHPSNPVRKWAKRILSGVKLFVGGAAVSHGAIYGVTQVASGSAGPEKLPREMVWAYTGVNIDDGSFNGDQLKKSLITIVAGLGVAALIGFANKRL